MTPAVTISARRDSRCRCGVEHTREAVPYSAGFWTDDQLRALRDDPELVVVETGESGPGSFPTTPTVNAALSVALEALRQATPDQVRTFFGDAAADPAIAAKIGAIAPRDPGEEKEPPKPAPEAEKEAPEPAPAAPPAERVRATPLREAIAALVARGKEGDFTRGGKPKIDALEAVSSLPDITAAERDAAWETFQRERETS